MTDGSHQTLQSEETLVTNSLAESSVLKYTWGLKVLSLKRDCKPCTGRREASFFRDGLRSALWERHVCKPILLPAIQRYIVALGSFPYGLMVLWPLISICHTCHQRHDVKSCCCPAL